MFQLTVATLSYYSTSYYINFIKIFRHFINTFNMYTKTLPMCLNAHTTVVLKREIPHRFELCSTCYTVLQMKKSTKSASAKAAQSLLTELLSGHSVTFCSTHYTVLQVHLKN